MKLRCKRCKEVFEPDGQGQCPKCGHRFAPTKQSIQQNLQSIRPEETFFAPEKRGIKKGVLGGAIMMVIAIVWFVAGWAAGVIFFYPPILFIIGLFALIKGLVTGNLAGKK